MLKIDYEYRKGILFVRLRGHLTKDNINKRRVICPELPGVQKMMTLERSFISVYLALFRVDYIWQTFSHLRATGCV